MFNFGLLFFLVKTYHIYHSYKELPKEWDTISNHDIFLQRQYFKALEQASPTNIQWFYVGIFNGEEIIGIALIQRVQLYLNDLFRQTKVSCVKEFFKNGVMNCSSR